MPSALRQAEWSPASSTSSSTSASRKGPSSGELSASTRRAGPSPPTRLVSDGGSSTITVETLAEGVNGYRSVPCQAGSANGASGGGGGAMGTSPAIRTTGAS